MQKNPSDLVLRSEKLAGVGFSHGFSLGPLDFRDVRLGEHAIALANAVGFEPEDLYQVSQVHGARVRVARGDREAMLRAEADALVAIASESPRTVGVRVADCTPVLVGDEASGSVAAIHAGWRGVVAGVIAAGVGAIGAKDPSKLVAAIGPCIGVCCFEVGDDVAAQIAAACGDAAVVVRDRGPKAHVDMRRASRAQLRTVGIADDRIDDVEGCTKCGGERFHSHRRDGERAGRSIAVIRARG